MGCVGVEGNVRRMEYIGLCEVCWRRRECTGLCEVCWGGMEYIGLCVGVQGIVLHC